MMNKYALGTIVGAALLGLAKSKGSMLKLKQGYLVEPTKLRVFIEYNLEQNKDLYNDDGSINISLAREFLHKKIKKELEKHDIKVLTIKGGKGSSGKRSGFMLITGNPTFTLPSNFETLDVHAVKKAYEKVISEIVEPLGFTIVPDSFYKYSTTKNLSVNDTNQYYWGERFHPHIKHGILVNINEKWMPYEPKSKKSNLRIR